MSKLIRRPSLRNADPVVVSEHLLSKGITSSIGVDEKSMYFKVDIAPADLTAALADLPEHPAPKPSAVP